MDLSITTHTPGPWKVHPNDPDYVPIRVVQAGAKAVATVIGFDHLPSELDANAALIAAAPEMLDALHHILNIEGACHGADASWNLDWHWDKVREAIAKAEGRS